MSTVVPTVPLSLETIVTRCLAKDPAKRCSLSELAAALATFGTEESVGALRRIRRVASGVRLKPRTFDAGGPPAVTPGDSHSPVATTHDAVRVVSPRSSFRKWMSLAAAASLLVTIGVAAATYGTVGVRAEERAQERSARAQPAIPVEAGDRMHPKVSPTPDVEGSAIMTATEVKGSTAEAPAVKAARNAARGASRDQVTPRRASAKTLAVATPASSDAAPPVAVSAVAPPPVPAPKKPDAWNLGTFGGRR